MLSTSVMDTTTMATRCVLSAPGGWLAGVLAVDHTAVVVVGATVVVIVTARVVGSQDQVLPLADQTTESTCLVRLLSSLLF